MDPNPILHGMRQLNNLFLQRVAVGVIGRAVCESVAREECIRYEQSTRRHSIQARTAGLLYAGYGDFPSCLYSLGWACL